MIERRTVGIVGVGHVGAHVAYSLGMMGVTDEILLCDIDEKKLTSECNDLNDAVPFMPNRVLPHHGLRRSERLRYHCQRGGRHFSLPEFQSG